jgi:hypothetical protein
MCGLHTLNNWFKTYVCTEEEDMHVEGNQWKWPYNASWQKIQNAEQTHVHF